MSYSVVIPAYNAEHTIEETLASVFQQSMAPHEVIVVDDGSIDQTHARVASLQQRHPCLRLIRQSNTGPGQATTRGLEQATQSVIATLDADDLWLPDKMARQLNALAASNHPQALVFTHMQRFRHTDPHRVLAPKTPGLTRSTLVCHRTVFEQIGSIIDPPGGNGDMVDWIARCREADIPVIMLSDALALRRIIQTSMTYTQSPAQDRGYLHVARMAMLRRRGTTDD